MLTKKMFRIEIIVIPMLILFVMLGHAQAQEGVPEEEPAGQAEAPPDGPGSFNLISNGNFEFGFYGIPWIGFEAGDWSGVPSDWKWFKNDKAYGKYRIYDNRDFGLICMDDFNQTESNKISVSFHMQSTDDPNARLGIYQTVNVVPGREYMFAISGTIQAQKGQSVGQGKPNNTVQIAFDESGGDNWRAIPTENWVALPWREQELEYKVSSSGDPDLAKIEDYLTVIKPNTNKLTIFVTAHRQLPNWRSVRYTLDCVSLIPMDKFNTYEYADMLSNYSATSVDLALNSPTTSLPTEIIGVTEVAEIIEAAEVTNKEPAIDRAVPPAETSAIVRAEQASVIQAAKVEPAVIIPDSGGIPDVSAKALLVMVLAGVVVIGLIGAGVWNVRRDD
jgi:hypothetical protein